MMCGLRQMGMGLALATAVWLLGAPAAADARPTPRVTRGPRPIVSPGSVGEQRVLVIMARFPDVTPSFTPEQMRAKYFDKLDRYLKAVSYGKAWVTGKTTPWYVLPRPVGRYRISQHNLGVQRTRVSALIRDAIDLADKDEQFADYSMVFISLGAKRTDYGMMGLCGYPGMLGWRQALPLKTGRRGQPVPGGVAIYCEQAHVGVVFHDMAHIMGGVRDGRRVVPCLYDHDLQGRPGRFRNYAQFYLVHVGFFDPMSCHFYRLDRGPPGVCAWTKLRLEWIEPTKITDVSRGTTRTVLLGPLSSGRARMQVVRVPISTSTYYLIENRQSIGPDRNLPSHGVLIYRCDDTVVECRHGQAPARLVCARPDVPELRGAPYTLEGVSTFQSREDGVAVRLTARKAMAYQLRVSNGR